MAFFDQIEKIKASILAKVNALASGDQVQVSATQDALKGMAKNTSQLLALMASRAGDVCAI